QAYERVHFESPTLSGDVHHLQVWLRRPPSRGPASGAPIAGPARPATPVAAAAPAAPAVPGVPATSGAPGQQMHVAGNLLQVEAVVGEKTTEVRRVHMEGKVRLREKQVAQPGTRPLLVQGDQLDVDQPAPNEAVVHVVGAPAQIEAREMT